MGCTKTRPLGLVSEPSSLEILLSMERGRLQKEKSLIFVGFVVLVVASVTMNPLFSTPVSQLSGKALPIYFPQNTMFGLDSSIETFTLLLWGQGADFVKSSPSPIVASVGHCILFPVADTAKAVRGRLQLVQHRQKQERERERETERERERERDRERERERETERERDIYI